MLNIKNLSKAYGPRTLLDKVALHVNRAERIALVGANGSGKSTIFRMIIGVEQPDAGVIVINSGTVIGYLPQETTVVGAATVLETATSITPEIARMQEQAGRGGEAGVAARARLDELRIYEIEPRAQTMLAGLGFRQTDFRRPLRNMSGGWIMRAHLARLLVQQPDLLMLDEPTNHLDLASLLWLQDYLKKYPGAILMISHDRAFINGLINRVLEIDRTALRRYRGNYDDYLRERAANREQQLAAYRNQQREMAALQRFADRFRAKATKAAQAQSRLKRLERMEQLAPPETEGAAISFQWPQPPRSGRCVMTLTGIHQSYGETTVYRGLDYQVERGQRTVLVGPNGAGKSTLMKLLAGVIPFQAGRRATGLNVKLGYYAQHRLEMLQPGRTVMEEALCAGAGEQAARNLLGAFLFRGDDVFKRVEVLSGGEKSRLALVKLLMDPPNFLLMDEPTTHLDIPSMDALINALTRYQGTLLFISHDVYFIRAIAETVLHVEHGQLTPYAGNYDYYLERTALSAPAADAGGVSGVNRRREQRRQAADARREALAHRGRLRKVETRISDLEQRQTELTAALEDQSLYARPGAALPLTTELKQVVQDLQDMYRKWEALAEHTLD